MASRCRLVLVLFYAWSWRMDTDATRVSALARRHAPDTLTEHMQTLYAKYNRAGHAFKDGNTVRSFKAHQGSLGGRRLMVFNLTSLTRSESVLSATLHFFNGDLPQRSKQRRQSGRLPLDVWTFGSDPRRALGHVHFDVSVAPGGAWQWRNITRAVNQAKGQDELLVGVKLEPHTPQLYPPYVLVYANDSAISEPESLQRHHLPTLETALQYRLQNSSKKTPPPRHRRSANLLSPLQNNELPGQEYPTREYPTKEYPGSEYPEQDYPYKPLNWDKPVEQNKPQNARRTKKKSSKTSVQKGALLQFDERAIKKARRKWAEPRSCARRHLKVDFADIGWSDWIISPKSYDAFYCAGSCQFPMAKALKPSNHATIQSIVRAVGVVPGVPEPCCVPEKMSSLSILFFDEQANVVLKVYPNMSVESCACR